jgi:class 3 adenylate cyclase/glyoxylase-like metal-dependent hydrolase (beta-lactamase superfamily II)
MKMLDDAGPVEVAPGLWRVGFADYEAGFSNNPYLLVDGDEAILFDPGPGHPFFKYLIMEKIERIIPLDKVRYVVVHHQDPDLAGLVPLLEVNLHPELVVVSPPRAALFLPYYGIRSPILPVRDGESLQLRSGRRIRFLHLPYLHFAGNMASYDERDRTLFSSDVFGGFNRSWHLFASDDDVRIAHDFLAEYVSSKDALKYAHEKLSRITIDRICPQHGSVIRSSVRRFIDMLLEVEPGRALLPPPRKATPEEKAEIVANVRERLSEMLGRPFSGNCLDDLVQEGMEETMSDVSLVVGLVADEAQRLGVGDPLDEEKVHTEENIHPVSTQRVLDAVQRRLLTRQLALGRTDVPESRWNLAPGLMSVKQMMALLFVDIRRFTRWCDGREADHIFKTLSRQLDLEVRIIRSNGGRINKVLGDGILAFFPAHKAADCVAAAVQMQRRIQSEGMLPVGAGCAFGEVIVGDLGEEARLDFTLIGEPVNTAARMCDSAASGEVCVSEELVAEIGPEAWNMVTDGRQSERFEVKVKTHDTMSVARRIFVVRQQ